MNYRLLQNIGNINDQIFYRDNEKNNTFSGSVEALIFNEAFIKEFNKPKKSEFMKTFINTVFKDYWLGCWVSLTLCDKPCGLSYNRAKLIIKYVEYCFNCEGTFKLESTEKERKFNKEISGSKSVSTWDGERFVDVLSN